MCCGHTTRVDKNPCYPSDNSMDCNRQTSDLDAFSHKWWHVSIHDCAWWAYAPSHAVCVMECVHSTCHVNICALVMVPQFMLLCSAWHCKCLLSCTRCNMVMHVSHMHKIRLAWYAMVCAEHKVWWSTGEFWVHDTCSCNVQRTMGKTLVYFSLKHVLASCRARSPWYHIHHCPQDKWSWHIEPLDLLAPNESTNKQC